MSHTKTTSGSGLLSLKRYEEYYLSGGDLYFLVEHHVFRIHRYFFERESPYFKSKLTISPVPGAIRQGTNESNAIVLEDVRVHEFARFLWVFYNPRYSLYYASVDDWSSILSLAHRWTFPEVKALAIRELEKLGMPDIDRVVVYHANDVDRNLLISRYAALCEREEPLTLPEGQRLGLETTLMLARAREFARAPLSTPRSPTVSTVRGTELFAMVRELFGIPEPETSEEDVVIPEPSGGPIPPLSPSPPSLTAMSLLMAQQMVTPPQTETPPPRMETPKPKSTPQPPPPSPPPQVPERPLNPPPVVNKEAPPPPPKQTETPIPPVQPQAPPPPRKQTETPIPPVQPQPQPQPEVQTQEPPQLEQPLDKVKLQLQTEAADHSRPQSPAPDTPVTETSGTAKLTPAQKRAAKKAKKALQEAMTPTGSQTPRNEEVVVPVVTKSKVEDTNGDAKESVGEKKDGPKDQDAAGEKKVAEQSVPIVSDKKDKVGDVSQETGAGPSTEIVVPSNNAEEKKGDEKKGDEKKGDEKKVEEKKGDEKKEKADIKQGAGSQAGKLNIDTTNSASNTDNWGFSDPSDQSKPTKKAPTTPLKPSPRVQYGDYLKSPQEKEKSSPGGLLGSMWKSLK